MYIDPFVAGILVTIGTELLLVVVWAVISTFKDKFRKRR